MLSTGSAMRRVLSALAVTAVLLTGLPSNSVAQSSSGWTIFGGPRRENQLSYRLARGTADDWDRYLLRIPGKKVSLAILQFAIDYPDYYQGEFDPQKVEVRVGKKAIALQDVVWNRENRLIEIYPQEPIPAGKDIELIFSNVRNPTFGGMFNFNCRIISPGGPPLPRYLGTWVVSID